LPNDRTVIHPGDHDPPTLPNRGVESAPAFVSSGKFEVLDVVGVGGSGVVYKVRHRQLNHLRAIKVLTTDAGEEAIERLRREASIATELTHPNIVRVYDLETLDDGSLAVVMEYLEGEDLAERVLRDGSIPEDEVVRMFRPVADGLDRMHAAGVLHRDIKPANLFVCEDGTVKILDFSASRLAESESELTRAGQLVGTPLYMAPEQFEGEGATTASDIYSLGTTLFHALTGRPPFQGSSRTELTLSILDADRPRARAINSSLSPRISRSIRAAMARKPEERWSTAVGMIDAMGETSTAKIPAPPRKRASVPGWLVAAVVLGVSIAAVGAAWMLARARTPAHEEHVSHHGPSPVRGGTLRMGLSKEIPSLDPTILRNGSFWGLQFLLHDPLVEVDWNGDILPGLAHSWEVADDRSRFVFHLRDDAVLHDDPCLPQPNHALDARDVQRSLERVFTLLAQGELETWRFLPPVRGFEDFVAGRCAHPDGLRVLDAHTLEVTFDAPAPTFLHSLSWPVWSVVAAEAIDTYGPADLGYRAVGTGPFALERADAHSAHLVRHAGAWHTDAAGHALPWLDRVDVTVFSSEMATTTALQSKKIDMVYHRATRTIDAMFELGIQEATPREGWESFRAEAYIDEARRYLSLLVLDRHSDHPIASDARIRRALARAIRRADQTEDPYLPAVQPLVDGMLGYEPRIVVDGDTEGARQLLAEAGYPDGDGLPALSMCTRATKQDQAEALVSQLSAASIEVQLNYVEYETWMDFLVNGGCDLVYAGYIHVVVDDDASDLLRGLAAFSHLEDRRPEVTETIRQMGETDDREARGRLSAELSRTLVDDAMVVFLSYRSPERPIFRSVAHERVRGLTDPATGWMNPRRHRMHQLWLAPNGEDGR
jgi:ABC-type transport system substrate-binding protein/tRNA A-37 threonylcarbamoyl transferase component Bud32